MSKIDKPKSKSNKQDQQKSIQQNNTTTMKIMKQLRTNTKNKTKRNKTKQHQEKELSETQILIDTKINVSI